MRDILRSACLGAAILVGVCGTSTSATTVNQAFGTFTDLDATGGTSFDFFVAETGTIQDVNLALAFGILFFPTVFLNDLEMSLSHLSTTVLFSDNLFIAGFAPISATFDDDGGGTVPSNPLSAFDALDVGGIWTLSFLDTTNFTNERNTVFGTLIAGVQPIPLPASLVLLLSGLGALGVIGTRPAAGDRQRGLTAAWAVSERPARQAPSPARPAGCRRPL